VGQGRRVMTVVAIVVVTALSFATPSVASPTSVPPADNAEEPAEILDLHWSYCGLGATNVIFRRTGYGCTAGLDSVGHAALTRQPGGYRLQVCATQTDRVAMNVDPADANGNSTGNIIQYVDDPYGPCYNRNIGYPIRKFQMVHRWVLGTDVSAWQPPP
jgi:hypothetical protein